MNGHSRFRPLIYGLFFAAIGALVVLLVSVLVQVNQATDRIDKVTGDIRLTQTTNSSTLLAIAALSKQFDDCISPAGVCYDAERARNAEQIGATNANTIAAAFCAYHHHAATYRELTACVDRLLNGHHAERRKKP